MESSNNLTVENDLKGSEVDVSTNLKDESQDLMIGNYFARISILREIENDRNDLNTKSDVASSSSDKEEGENLKMKEYLANVRFEQNGKTSEYLTRISLVRKIEIADAPTKTEYEASDINGHFVRILGRLDGFHLPGNTFNKIK